MNGATVVDTDVGARRVVEPGEPALLEIKRVFGNRVLQPDDTLDRAAMRTLVFRDPQARQQLEAIIHPQIFKWTAAEIQAASGPYVLLVVPLLVETSNAYALNRVVVVDATEELQRARLMARDGSSSEEVDRILTTQCTRTERLEIADDIIDNSGSREQLSAQVDRLHQLFLSLAKKH